MCRTFYKKELILNSVKNIDYYLFSKAGMDDTLLKYAIRIDNEDAHI